MTTKPKRLFSFRTIAPNPTPRADGEGLTYALATERYVAQDGWVLLAAGVREWKSPLPALWAHDSRALPLGYWQNVGPVGNEVRADIRWMPDANPQADAVRKFAEAGVVSVSVGFRVEEWHSPDEKEREKYGIPKDEPYAGIATRWVAREASFVPVPADPGAGGRSVREIVIERGLVTAESFDELFPDRDDRNLVEDLLEAFAQSDRQQSELLQCIRSLEETVRCLQRTVETRVQESPRVVAPRSEAANATAKGRLYNIETLGMTVDAAIAKIGDGSVKAVATHARDHSRGDR